MTSPPRSEAVRVMTAEPEPAESSPDPVAQVVLPGLWKFPAHSCGQERSARNRRHERLSLVRQSLTIATLVRKHRPAESPRQDATPNPRHCWRYLMFNRYDRRFLIRRS